MLSCTFTVLKHKNQEPPICSFTHANEENESRSFQEQFVDLQVHFLKSWVKRRRIKIWRIFADEIIWRIIISVYTTPKNRKTQ